MKVVHHVDLGEVDDPFAFVVGADAVEAAIARPDVDADRGERVSVLIVRGSMRTPAPAMSGTVCDVASVPSAKRYQLSVAFEAVDDCSRIGVVQPLAPPRLRVTFGR